MSPYHFYMITSKFRELWSVAPCGNKFDLKVGQRSRHGATRKGLSQGLFIPNINALSYIASSEDMSQIKVFMTDRQTKNFNVPTELKFGGQ